MELLSCKAAVDEVISLFSIKISRSTICRGYKSVRVGRYIKADMKSFHFATAENSIITAKVDLQRGRMMRNIMVKSLAPSKRAASSSASEIPCIAVRMIMILNTLSIPGTTMAQRVSNKPRLRTIMYIGIIPPLKSIVELIMSIKVLRNRKRLRENT